jgi:hypothetical protein
VAVPRRQYAHLLVLRGRVADAPNPADQRAPKAPKAARRGAA